MKNSELKKLVTEYNNLKRRSKNHDVSNELKMIERRYFHETGNSINDELDGKKLYDLYRHTTKLIE
jgi:hypothetical protein|tara:strand:- start:69 stop:266 length:198 start_codon:yes stop_codon:yes gene_type:complete